MNTDDDDRAEIAKLRGVVRSLNNECAERSDAAALSGAEIIRLALELDRECATSAAQGHALDDIGEILGRFGSRGCFDTGSLADAKEEIARLLAGVGARDKQIAAQAQTIEQLRAEIAKAGA